MTKAKDAATKPAAQRGSARRPAPQGDERFAKSRGGEDESRASRDSEDVNAMTDSGLTSSDEERLMAALQDGDLQDQLPKLKAPEGAHLCWLSTTNQYDPIQARIRIGYTPVRPPEIPGAAHLRSKHADYGDVIAVNEMILFKIPESLYQRIMNLRHHQLPNEEAMKLKNKNDEINDMVGRDSAGRALITEEEGFRDLSHAPARRPSFN